jgi:hypothetical protein
MRNEKQNFALAAALLCLALVSASCATTQSVDGSAPEVTVSAESQATPPDPGEDNPEMADAFEILPEIETGGGAIQGDLEFLNIAEGNLFDVEAFRRQIEAEERPSGIVFNFEGADIKRVVALVIGRILNENYLIDPNVKGTVTLKTERPLNRETVFYMLESVLDLYGAKISPRCSASATSTRA